MVIPPGYSIGDFIVVGQLVWRVYKACKGAPGDFQELSRELSTLHTIIHELEDEAKTPTSLLNRRGSGRKSELDGLLQNLSGVLEQIEDIAERYHSLGRDQKRAWDRIKFAGTDLATLRSKLLVHISGINVFVASLSAGSLARIEAILDDLIRDIKAGKKEPSVISARQSTDEAAWIELERELIGDGITKQDIGTHKEDIKEYLKKLIQESLAGIRSESVDSLTCSLDNLQLGNGPIQRRYTEARGYSSEDDMNSFDEKEEKCKPEIEPVFQPPHYVEQTGPNNLPEDRNNPEESQNKLHACAMWIQMYYRVTRDLTDDSGCPYCQDIFSKFVCCRLQINLSWKSVPP